MNLQTIKKSQAERGFTLVELLIVIVVIGILAAIVIVAYNGIQNRAKTTKSQTNAVAIQKKAEAYNADVTGYPPTPGATDGSTAGSWYAYSIAAATKTAPGSLNGLSPIVVTSTDPDVTNGTTNIGYKVCGTNAGYKVTYWDFGAGALNTSISGGDTSGTCS